MRFSSPSPAPADDEDLEGLRTFQVVAAQDMPFYGSFTVEAANPEAALAKAKGLLLADAGQLNEAEADGAHSLRIVSLQEDDQDPIFHDVSLDPDAPLWPGRESRAALLATTAALAQLVSSLGEAEAYPTDLDQLTTNLRLFHLESAEANRLVAARATAAPEDWVEQVMHWAWAQSDSGAAR